MKKVVRIIIILLFLGGIISYIVYLLYTKPTTNEEAECCDIVFNMNKSKRSNFIDESGLEELLNSKKINPIGKKIKDINLTEIEKVLSACQYIDSVECYITSSNNVCVSVRQRTPVVYVMPDSMSSGYYVDSRGEIIENTGYSNDIVVATGDITPQYAKTELASLGNFLLNEPFWDSFIEQIHVINDKANGSVVECVPRVGNQIIYLGTINDFEKKFRRLKTFYDKVIPEVGWNRYSRFNLEFANQVVCTKRPTSYNFNPQQ